MPEALHAGQALFEPGLEVRVHFSRLDERGVLAARQGFVPGGEPGDEGVVVRVLAVGVHGGVSSSCWSRSMARDQSLRTALEVRPIRCATSSKGSSSW